MKTMNLLPKSIALSCLVGGLLWAGCGDIPLSEPVEEEFGENTEPLAKGTPEFRITGLDDAPEELLIEELGITVTEIRLEPVDGTDRGLAYSTSNPLTLEFDLTQGQTELRGQEVTLPELGQFLVSVRLEPVEEVGTDEFLGSLELRGHVRNGYLVKETEEQQEDRYKWDDDRVESTDERGDGSPVPLPVQRIKNEDQQEEMWTPFAMSSSRTVYYTFSDVELVPGAQDLTFTFDINDWAMTAANPIIDAVEQSGAGGIVDVSSEVDSTAADPEVLLESSSVSMTVQ